MAFLPRARACYLNRKSENKAARFLDGRVRLGLSLQRGEMQGVQVMESTLARPDIEACLRDAAWALHVPRPAGQDHPVLAIVNLVFRPVTPDDPGGLDAALEQELDIVLAGHALPWLARRAVAWASPQEHIANHTVSKQIDRNPQEHRAPCR
jgi:hypothetical protein